MTFKEKFYLLAIVTYWPWVELFRFFVIEKGRGPSGHTAGLGQGFMLIAALFIAAIQLIILIPTVIVYACS